LTYCSITVEDDLSQGVVQKLLQTARPDCQVHVARILSGSGQIRRNILALNNACRSHPQLVLTDLDLIACPPVLLAEWMGARVRHAHLWFRIAVREVEAWLLAHREAVSVFFDIQINLVPHNPEQLRDPKQSVVSLARYSPLRKRKLAIVPIGTATQGPDYNAELLKFVWGGWEPGEARRSSPSLDQAMRRLDDLPRN
jgi:hypothetical protein